MFLFPGEWTKTGRIVFLSNKYCHILIETQKSTFFIDFSIKFTVFHCMSKSRDQNSFVGQYENTI